VFGWGNNEYGQLGLPTDDPQISTPVPLDLSDLDGELVSMATGGAFTAFSTSTTSTQIKQ
jgi:alpha-tubulin suppressor-like RCC1 family protein